MSSTRPSVLPKLGRNRTIPVLVLASAKEGVAVARALAAGGVTVAEVTLRTAAALDAIAAIAAECPDVLVGAGTILNARDIEASLKAGAQFLVTPGTSPDLRKALVDVPVPVLPGAVTISEMLTLAELGFGELKFFPAGAAGGLEYLKSVAGPCPHLKFCPTGGVGPANMGDYLKLSNVFAVGGSWLTPKAAVDAGDWAAITRLAQDATG
jgi:2-dehydro-3-deoxyphosphogluconate aldolase/(4S)-4-hydroxy-2-oxoglutarate aldolase